METKAIAIDHPLKETTPAKPAKKYLGNIHYFRGIAILFVIAGHVMVDWQPDSIASKILGATASNATILFLFIAGYLFQHLSHKYEYKDYLVKKFQNVICPYLIISAPVVALRVIYGHVPFPTLQLHPDFAAWPKWEQTFYYLLHGAHLTQLWFIPMIAIYYVISPLFIYIDRHPRFYYALIPLFILSFVVPRAHPNHTLAMSVHFLSVYIFSMFMSHYRERSMALAHRYRVLLTVVPLALIVVNYFVPQEIYDQVSFLQRVLSCYALLYWLARWEKYMPSTLSTLADLSFGIYFVHFFFLMAYQAIYQKVFQHSIPGNVLQWIIEYLFAAVLSVLFLKLARRVLQKKSKYFVGC